MWKIKDVKKQGIQLLKSNLWTLLFISIFMGFIIGDNSIFKDGFSNLKLLGSFIQDRINDEEIDFFSGRDGIVVNKYIDKIISQVLFGNSTGNIENFNKEHNVTKGLFFTAFNTITKKQSQLHNIASSLIQYINETKMTKFVILVTSVCGFLIKVFISYPILVGESRVYLESANYQKTRVKRILYAFSKGRYWVSVKTVFLRNLYKTLWNFTIVGGIIKNYSYKMVNYIIAENPQIKPNDAITMSRKMMNGNKKQAFYMDFSFMGWLLLEYFTFGLAGIFVDSYYKSVYASLYKLLRNEYIENKDFNYELLNDTKLFEETTLSKYPENKKKIKIDYNKTYNLTSIIIFFFVFSFVGWLWEVSLYLFRDGILVNRGTLYGPWLPIYGVGCTLLVVLTRFRKFRKMLKNPVITFSVIMVLCTVIEYFTHWYIEMTSGLKYWDYSGIFMNINGRVCLECSLFFGFGGSICIYFIVPFLEAKLQKISKNVKVLICTILVLFFGCDTVYSHFNPHEGEGITAEVNKNNEEKKLNLFNF